MIISSKNIPDKIFFDLIKDIKAKKELSGIDDSLVSSEMVNVISHDRNLLEFASSQTDFKKIKKSSKYKEIIKKTRAILRKSVGVFIRMDNSSDFDQLLVKHESTKERMPIYSEIYKRIFHITGSPKSILDLGCGLNPLSYKYLKIKPIYYAVDISSSIIEIVNNFFRKIKIKGQAEIMNLREIKNKKLNLPKADICFMFKLLDSLEIEKGHKLAEKLIKEVPCKWLAVSFSTKTLSGKKMNHPYRGWIEQLCRRLGYFYEIIEFENELFYLVRK